MACGWSRPARGGRAYRLERRIRFAREGNGYRAEVPLSATDGETSDGSGALFEAGYAALAGTTPIFHLDGAGTIERLKFAERIAAPLRALPADRQRAMLGSLVLAIIPDELLAPGTSPIRLAGSSAYGSAGPLEGTRTVITLPGGALRSTTVAGADGVALEWVTEVDSRTGLITRNSKTLRFRTGGLEKTSRTQLTVEPLAD